LADDTPARTEKNSLELFFRPRSIAVVGASNDPNKLGALPMRFLPAHGFDGPVFQVNPNYSEIGGEPCFASVADIAEPVDLALVVVPAQRVLAAVQDCAAAGVVAAIVFAGGFADAGAEGADRARELADFLADAPIRVLGPNCMGLVNVRDRVAASVSQSLLTESLRPGSFAFVSQSGAIAGSVMDLLHTRGLGLSHWVSTGNEIDLTAIECAEYLVETDGVDVIGMYLESVVDAERYVRLALRARERGTSIVVLRAGRSDVGALAAVSHTGAIAGNAAVFDAVSRQHGVIVVNDTDELLDCAESLLPRRFAAGRRIGVVSSSGGAGVLLADAAERWGFTLPTLADATLSAIARIAPPNASVRNPVDLTAGFLPALMNGELGLWHDTCLAVAQDDAVDVLVVALTMIAGDAGVRLAGELVAVAAESGVPMLVVWLAGDLCDSAIATLRTAGIPVYTSPQRCLRAAAALVHAAPPMPAGVVDTWSAQRVEVLPVGRDGVHGEWSCRPLLAALDIATPDAVLVSDEAQACAAAERLGPVVVLKAAGDEIVHRDRIGGVRVGVPVADVPRAYREVVAAAAAAGVARTPVMVARHVAVRAEFLVGITRDRHFGHVFVIGRGGVDAERLTGSHVWLPPLPDGEVTAILRWLGVDRLVPPAALDGFAEILLAMENLRRQLGHRLLDFEINPLALTADGRWLALDAFLRTEGSE
jgi:acyl-CoA synthetase (NDP forming)